MDTRELGLVLLRQLFGLEDLHYGLWEDDLELSLHNAPLAQRRYNDMLVACLPPPAAGTRVLDVGCGTGVLLRRLLELGYLPDGVNPSPFLSGLTRERVKDWAGHRPRIYESRFEDLPVGECRSAYDVVLFSESFQYIPLDRSIPLASELLAPGGTMIVCDFFRTDADGDGGPGDGSFGGGHRLSDFRARMCASRLRLLLDRDVTTLTSPNLELVNDLLMNRVRPSALSIRDYLEGHYPLATRLALRLFRERIRKIHFKYLSGHRCKEVFERYKSYRLFVYRLGEVEAGVS
jgi:SAM-dependent methyltransferase